MAPVHDVTENIDEVLEGDFPSLVLLKLLIEDQVRITEVTNVEGVAHVPSLRSEPLSLDQCGVEVAEGKEDALDLGILILDFILGEVLPCAEHVSLESIGRLLYQLNGAVKNADGDQVLRLGREE